MFSFIFLSFCLSVMVNNVQSQTIRSKLDLFLINSTSPICDFNSSIFGDKSQNISLCLDDSFGYSCAPNDTNSVTLDCSLANENTQCHSFVISESQNYNYSLDCFYRKLNSSSIGNQFNLKHVNECLYGIISDTQNESLYVCSLFQPLITVTTFNNTNVFQQSSNKYKFPLFGFEVNKKVLKRYAVPIIVGIIVVFCLLVLCCYGMCRLCWPNKMRRNRSPRCNQNFRSSHSNQNYRSSRCNQNSKMPQSSSCNI
jgi:hypothetical protein